MTTPRLLAVFTEGDTVRGLGHVSRCSAYAQAWLQRGGQVWWILDGDEAAIALIGAGQKVIRRRWQEDAEIELRIRPDVALVDSYDASADAMEAIAARADLSVFIDDLGGAYPPGFVVHPAPDRTASQASADAGLLYGPAWQPLRPAFWDLPARGPAPREIQRVLVIFGGGDLRGMGVAMAHLARHVRPAASIDLVLGAGRPLPEAMPGISVHQAIDAEAMAALMLAADVAISGAGQTVFELARCGTPSVLVGIADNQQANLEHWPALCGYVRAGWWSDIDLASRVEAGIESFADPAQRERVSDRAASVVDGQGVRRLFEHLERSTVQEQV